MQMCGANRFGVGATMLTVVLLWAAAGAQAQEPERFEGLLASTAGGGFGGLAQIRIQIEEYTTDEETERFIGILAGEGWEALEREFRRIEKGRFIRVGQLGHDIAFARSIPHETGRIVRLATARPIAFAEAARPTRSSDYAFGFIELRLDEEGQGSGIVIAAAKVEFNDEGQLEIESYGHPPFSITEISVQD